MKKKNGAGALGIRMLRLETGAASLLGCMGLAHLWFHVPYTLDDAYITYRYSRNLARGLGLAYNPGEYVKGYSNTLYTLLMSGPELFGHDPNPLSKLLGFVAFVWVAWVVRSLYVMDSVAAVRDRALWAIALLAGSTAIAVHFTSGLETGLYTALLCAAVARRLEEQRCGGRPWSALLFSAAVLSRPEAVLIFALLAFHDVCLSALTRRFTVRDLVFLVLPPLAYAGELAFSIAYYGDPFPQTYYAKTGATHDLVETARALLSGFELQLHEGSYLAKGLAQAGLGLPLLAALPLTLISKRFRRRNLALLLVVLAQLLFIGRAGGDWAPAFRFGVPMLPALLVLVVELLGLVAALARRFERPAACLLAGALLWLSVPEQLAESAEIQTTRYVNAENKLIEGRFLATLAPLGGTLSSFDIGGQGYGAGGLDVMDAGGLVTRELAGCAGRKRARCARYAALVLPDLVRLHKSARRDAFIGKAVARQAPYLALEGGRYLLRRGLVLGGEAPEWAVPTTSPAAAGGTWLVAVDAPPALGASESRTFTLYWRRGADHPTAFEGRRFEWQASGQRYSAQASEVLWKHVGSVEQWGPDELFSDLVTLRTPHFPARFELHAIASGRRTVVGTFDVLGRAASASRAAAWLAKARALSAQGHERTALCWYERATELAPNIAGGEAQRAVSDYARRLREAAAHDLDQAPIPTLRAVQAAKVLLHRSYWLSGHASAPLRSEIEANAAVRNRIIAGELR